MKCEEKIRLCSKIPLVQANYCKSWPVNYDFKIVTSVREKNFPESFIYMAKIETGEKFFSDFWVEFYKFLTKFLPNCVKFWLFSAKLCNFVTKLCNFGTLCNFFGIFLVESCKLFQNLYGKLCEFPEFSIELYNCR